MADRVIPPPATLTTTWPQHRQTSACTCMPPCQGCYVLSRSTV